MAWYNTLSNLATSSDERLAERFTAALDAISALRDAADQSHPSVSSAPLVTLTAVVGRPARDARVAERFEAARSRLAAGDTAALEDLDALWLEVDGLARRAVAHNASRRRLTRWGALALAIGAAALALWMRRHHPLRVVALDVVGPVPYAAGPDGFGVDPEWTDERLQRLAEVYFGHRPPWPTDLLVGMTAINPSMGMSHEAGRVDVIAWLETAGEVPYDRLPVDARLSLGEGPVLPVLAVSGLGPAVDVSVRLTPEAGHGDAPALEATIDRVAPRSEVPLEPDLSSGGDWQSFEVHRGSIDPIYVPLDGPLPALGAYRITPEVVAARCPHAGDEPLGWWARITEAERLRAVPGARIAWKFPATVSARGADLRGETVVAEWSGITGEGRLWYADLNWQAHDPCARGAGAGVDADADGVPDAMGDDPERAVEQLLRLGDHPGSAREQVIDVAIALDGADAEVGRRRVVSGWVPDRLGPGGHLRVKTELAAPRGGRWQLRWRFGGRPVAAAAIEVPATLPPAVRFAIDGVAGARARLTGAR